MEFYTIQDAEMNQYYQLPKILVHGEMYKSLSSTEKIAYAILKDRHTLSIKNGWVDEKNRVYFIFTDKELADLLEVSIRQANKIKNNLQKHGLIHMVRQGFTKPNIMYLIKPEPINDNDRNKSSNHDRNKSSNHERKKNSNQDRNKSSSKLTNNNKTDNNDTDSNVCEEEKEIISILKSREDINTHTQKEIKNLLNKIKEKPAFTYAIFKDTLEIIDFDFYDFSYFKRAVLLNLEKGFVAKSCIKRKEKLPEWFKNREEKKNPTLSELIALKEALERTIKENPDSSIIKKYKEELEKVKYDIENYNSAKQKVFL